MCGGVGVGGCGWVVVVVGMCGVGGMFVYGWVDLWLCVWVGVGGCACVWVCGCACGGWGVVVICGGWGELCVCGCVRASERAIKSFTILAALVSSPESHCKEGERLTKCPLQPCRQGMQLVLCNLYALGITCM